MVLDRAEDLKSIMSDNATFIQFPPIGSSTSLITVYGDHRVNVQRTIRGIMQLVCILISCLLCLSHFVQPGLSILCRVFLASPNPIQRAPPARDTQQFAGDDTLEANLAHDWRRSRLQEHVFRDARSRVRSPSGRQHDLGSGSREGAFLFVPQQIHDCSHRTKQQAFHHEIRFQVELANEHREFISGKKNGKINKIMQSASVKIKFETFNDHNFLIDLSGSDASILTGLTLLQEELPAEISFHVPEAYHKRIIGIGGRNIQRIMKKYGVYVKFSNAEEFAALGGYNDNEDNVVARTPSKNAINLDNLKQSVMEIVNPKVR